MKLVERIAFAIAIIAIVLIATANTAHATGKDGSSFTLYEGNNYTQDHWNYCGACKVSVPDLRAAHDDLFLGCDSLGHDNWDNCVSSFIVDIKSGSCLVMYAGYNYSGTQHVYWGPLSGGYNLGSGYDNTISSIRWGDRVLVNGIYQCIGTY